MNEPVDPIAATDLAPAGGNYPTLEVRQRGEMRGVIGEIFQVAGQVTLQEVDHVRTPKAERREGFDQRGARAAVRRWRVVQNGSRRQCLPPLCEHGGPRNTSPAGILPLEPQ